MIGKQTKGTSFSGCVCYVLKEEKSKLLEAVGVDGTPEQMAEQFELQSLAQPLQKWRTNCFSMKVLPPRGEALWSR